MVKRRGVIVNVDERFFKTFEDERQKEQAILRKKFGSFFNLSQQNFTAMLAAKKFRFSVPKQNPIIMKKIVRRRGRRRRKII